MNARQQWACLRVVALAVSCASITTTAERKTLEAAVFSNEGIALSPSPVRKAGSGVATSEATVLANSAKVESDAEAQALAQVDADATQSIMDYMAKAGDQSNVSAHLISNTQAQRSRRQLTARLAADQLLQLLEAVDYREQPLTETEFVPRCLAHVQKATKMISAAFDDDHIGTVLKQQCLKDLGFPHPRSDDFHREQTCVTLVAEVTHASKEKQVSGSSKRLENFCLSYVHNKEVDGLAAQMKELPRAPVAAPHSFLLLTSGDKPSIPFIALTAIISLCLVGSVFFFLRSGKEDH